MMPLRMLATSTAALCCLLMLLLAAATGTARAQGAPTSITSGPTYPGVQQPGQIAQPGLVQLPGSQLPIVGTEGPAVPAPTIIGATPLSGPTATPPNRCPRGYLEVNASRRLPHLIICEVAADVKVFCPAQPGYYACGINGSQCCAPNTANLCFPGAYACSPDSSIARGAAKTACCMGS